MIKKSSFGDGLASRRLSACSTTRQPWISCKRGPSTLAIKSVQVDGEVEVEVELECEVEDEEEVEEVGSSGDCGAGCPGQLQVSWRVVASGPPLATGPQAGVCRRAGRPPSATQ